MIDTIMAFGSCTSWYINMLTQIHELKSFLTQQTSSSGKGPCSLSHERADIDIQIHAARAYVAEFNSNDTCSAALQENTNPQVFIPSSGTRHRPVKAKTSIQGGAFVQKKKQKKTTVPKNIHIGLACQITVAEAILAEKEINCSPPSSWVCPGESVPEVVLMAALGIRRCHGCKGQILKQNCQSPKHLVFQMQALQIWRTKGWEDWQQCYGNVYFHLNISCLQLHNNKLTIEHVTMAADTFALLSQDHLCFLWKQELLEIILEKVRE